MKVRALIFPICLPVLAFGLGCSGEEQPTQFPRVVQAIEQRMPEVEKAPVVPEIKQEEQAAEKLPAQPLEKAPPTPTGKEPEKSAMLLKPDPVQPVVQEEPAPESRIKPGSYVVEKGDSLLRIASRDDTLQDPLKWPILLRLNRDKLKHLPAGKDFATTELPVGVELDYITPDEAKEELKKQQASRWIVNVLSMPNESEIVLPAVILAREGYPVYITRAQVKGKNVVRLRVGFFKCKKEALDQGEKIKSLLKFKDFWATRVEAIEYEEIAGFLKKP